MLLGDPLISEDVFKAFLGMFTGDDFQLLSFYWVRGWGEEGVGFLEDYYEIFERFLEELLGIAFWDF